MAADDNAGVFSPGKIRTATNFRIVIMSSAQCNIGQSASDGRGGNFKTIAKHHIGTIDRLDFRTVWIILLPTAELIRFKTSGRNARQPTPFYLRKTGLITSFYPVQNHAGNGLAPFPTLSSGFAVNRPRQNVNIVFGIHITPPCPTRRQRF